MTDPQDRQSTNLLLGALAGLVATGAMTAVMWRLHKRLPADERYPLPPREIAEQLLPDHADQRLRDETMLLHFAYGAATGAIVGIAKRSPSIPQGAAAGAAIWAASYFGWVPAFGILTPAGNHPVRRNALMITAHLVWGAAVALTLRELRGARSTMMNDRPARDAPEGA